MLFDTHAHYDDEAFDADRDQLLTALPDCGVGLVIDPGCDLTSSRRAVELAAAYPHVYAAVGIHPENCGGCTDDDLAALRPLAQQPKVVAIGEIGLDYYWEENPPREFQQQVFRRQLALARELQLPVIVHDREAHADTLSIVREFPDVTGVFHCFSGSPEMAQELLKLGWYLGFDGPVTYKNARRAPEVAAVTPLDRMLIETDSPYMTPVPYRGKRNDSGYVRLVAEKLAEWKGVAPEEMARLTTEDGKRLFLLFNVTGEGQLGEDGAEIYLPYSYFDLTAEEGMALAAKGIRPLIRHYLNENCTEKESLLGEYTAAGVRIVTRSFSPFLIDANGCTVGDLNGDGAVNTLDMQALYENLSTGRTTERLADKDDFRLLADCNGDGAVNILDYQKLYQDIKTA